MFLLAVGVMCLTACAQKKGGERGTRQGGHMEINKDSDSTFVALKNETLKKFKQLTFNDNETGKTMEYSLVPEGYDGTTSYPLVLFMADASTIGKEVTAPLTQGYGALEFASDRDQKAHPSFVLVPQYTDWAVQDDWSTTDEVEMTIRLLEKICKEYNVDTKRLYTTGQPVGHIKDAGLRQEEVLLHRGRWRPEGIWRHERPGRSAEGEQRPHRLRIVECKAALRGAGAISSRTDRPRRKHQLHQVGDWQRASGDWPCHGA